MTEDGRAGKALIRAKEEWELTFDSVPDLIAIIDNEHRILRANRAMLQRLGIEPAQCVGLHCYEIVHDAPGPPDFCPHARSLADGQTHSRELHEDRLGGDFIVAATPLKNDLGKIVGSVHVAHDITARRQAEDALRRSCDALEARVLERTAELDLEGKKLKSILDSMSDGVYIVNSRYEMVYANPVIRKRHGAPEKSKCYEYLHGEDAVCASCRIGNVFAGKTVQREWHSPALGRTFDILETPFADADGSPCKLAILRDITDRKKVDEALRESEERFRTLVETMNEGLVVHDERGVLTYVNKRFSETLGYSGEEIIGRPVTDFLGESGLAVYGRETSERAAGKRGTYEISTLKRDGEPVTAIVSARPLFDGRGQFKGSFAVITDITERKQAEDALRESERQLRRLSAQIFTAQETERRRLSSELHDELAQDLAALKLHFNFMEKNLPEGNKLLKRACRKGVRRIDAVMENVRRISRDLSPSILEDFGLTAAIRRLANDFAKNSGVGVTLDACDIDALIVRESHTAVYRIVQEALTNIGKHARAAHVSIITRKDDGMASLSIEDDGRGFDPTATARDSEMKGLGLATMKGRAEMIGGTFAVEAGPGRGTRILVRLPIKE
jgi:PAS domain S-box-containing protein